MPIIAVCLSCETRFTLQDELLGQIILCPTCGDSFVVKAEQEKPRVPHTGPGNTRSNKADQTGGATGNRTGSISDFLEFLPTENADEPGRSADKPADHIPTRNQGGNDPDYELVDDEPLQPMPPQPVEQSWSDGMLPPGSPPTSNPPSPRLTTDNSAKKNTARPGVLPPAKNESKQPPENNSLIVTHWQDTDHDPLAIEDGGYGSDPYPSYHDDEHDTDDDELIRPHKKKRRYVVIVTLILVIFGGGGLSVLKLKQYLDGAPDRLYKQATDDYAKGNYEPARKMFQKIVDDYPKNQHAGEAHFFAELCALRATVSSVTTRSDPESAENALDHFLARIASPELADYASPAHYALDIHDTILKLMDDVVGKAKDVFNQDSPEESEKWLGHAERLGLVVDKYREEGVGRENVYKQIEELKTTLTTAHERSHYLAHIRERLTNADDDMIEKVRLELIEKKFDGDPAFQKLLQDADKKIQDLVEYRKFSPPIKPNLNIRERPVTSMLFAPRLDNFNGRPRNGGGLPNVYFAIVRGVLYAMDEDDGHILWATRVGIDSEQLPFQIPASELHPDLVVVIAQSKTGWTLTARVAQNGQPLWQQALPTTTLGAPLLVGQRIFVPLAEKPTDPGEKRTHDQIGVVWEIEIASGAVLGKICLGRPLGTAPILRPHTGQIFLPAEAKVVYVFDVLKMEPDGSRSDPYLLGILSTGHAAGSLRGVPIITSEEGDTPGFLIVPQTNSLETMTLQAFALAAPDQPPAIIKERSTNIAIEGWSWYSPFCDGEKLAVVTDRGLFGLFGIQQAGNQDNPLFLYLPEPFALSTNERPNRGQVVYANEESFWILARGSLHRLRIGLNATNGLRLVPRGQPLPLGEPIHAAQVNQNNDCAVVVTQSTNSSSCRATALDLMTGEIRWQRQLGLFTYGEPLRIGDDVFLMDHDGALFQIPSTNFSQWTAATWLIDDRWLVAPPLENVVEVGGFFKSADGRSILAVMVQKTSTGLNLVIRQHTPGQVVKQIIAPLSAELAGNIIVVGGEIIVPTRNGLLHRVLLDGSMKFETGPTWRGDRVGQSSNCWLAAINQEEFIATDGSKRIERWRWPVNQDEFIKRGSIALSDRIAAIPLVFFEGEENRVALQTMHGDLTLWDADRLNTQARPVRVWQTGKKGSIPAGPYPTGPLLLGDDKNHQWICLMTSDWRVVLIDPTRNAPLWIANALDSPGTDGFLGSPFVSHNRIYFTSKEGKYMSLSLENGFATGAAWQLPGSSGPAASALPVGPVLLAPRSDGTVSLLKKNLDQPGIKMLFIPLPESGALIPIPVP